MPQSHASYFPDTKRKRKQTKANERKSNKRTKALRIAFCSPSDIIAMLKGLKNTRTKYHKARIKINRLRIIYQVYQVPLRFSPAGTQRWNNVNSTLIHRQDVESTLNRCCFSGVETTSIQLWFNVKTLNQRWIDVVSTVCACWLIKWFCSSATSCIKTQGKTF